MYYRTYANKNTTIFKKNTAGLAIRNGDINTGANPISEIMNGDGQSTFIMGFDISNLTSKLQNYSYTCNLKVWDAGTLFEPAMTPTFVDVLYFTEDFVEGDGYSFLDGKAIEGFANFNKRTALDTWGDALTNGDLHAFSMQKANEDWTIDVTSFIQDAVTFSVNPNFGLRIAVEEKAVGSLKLTSGSGIQQVSDIKVNGVTIIDSVIPFNTDLATTALDIVGVINGYDSIPDYTASIDPLDNTNILITPEDGLGSTANGYAITVVSTIGTTSVAFAGGVDSAYVFESGTTQTKFVHTRHTRTIFQPYLEFIINDEIIDGRYNAKGNATNTLYLLNDTGSNFVGTVTADILDSTGAVIASPTVNNPSAGQYTIDHVAGPTDKGLFMDQWKIGTEIVARNVYNVQSANQILTNSQTSNLFFYPNTTYPNQMIRKNDIVRFNVISEQRGVGTVIKTGYEYRIVTNSGFEICPWMPVQVYNSKMFFNVDTSYFYSEIKYEVFIRLVENGTIKTSSLTYSFTLTEDEATHLGTKSASPYQSRDRYFNK